MGQTFASWNQIAGWLRRLEGSIKLVTKV